VIETVRELGAEVVGISADKMRTQEKFVERSCLPFPVLCDERGTVIRAYGVRGLLGFAKRVSFLIDAEGIVRKVYRKVSPSRHAGEVIEDLRRLSGAT
jgi:peroxiredoxin Q/BCP